MGLLKSDLKISAGLLKEAAPENHLLAYITPGERDMLVEAGGKKTPTESGIFAYPPGEKYGGTNSSGGFNDPTPSSPGSNSNSNNTPSPGDTGGEGGTNPQDNSTTQFNNSFNDNDDIDSTYTDTSFNVTPEPVEKNFFEKVVDFVKGGGITGAVLKSIGGKLNPENKYEGITGEDGIGEGDFVYSSPNEYAQYEYGYNYKDLDTETQAEIDKAFYDSGHRSKAFQEFYNDGDTSNLNNLTNTERNEINKIIPDMAYDVGNTTPQESQAAKWYNSIGNTTQQFNFATAYANAKTKVSQQLNNKGPIGMLAVNDSPYYDWLKTKGLDKGIL
jgi:hypothetical protein